MAEQDHHPLAICVDCLFMLANGENGDWTPEAEADWAKAFAANTVGIDEITLGMHTDVCGCDLNSDDSDVHAESCEQLGFSWGRCDACDSRLGGDRFAATAWINRPELQTRSLCG